jgi:hypothetical protein
MEKFGEALVCQSKSIKIPDKHNLFGQFVGEWDFEWVDHPDTSEERHIPGEWIFSWILEGTAIQDVFICPSRNSGSIKTYPDAEYGTTIRIFNPAKQVWDIFYGCTGEATRLEARKENDTIVLTEITTQKMKWIFSEITENSFLWSRVHWDDSAETWIIAAKLYATRRKESTQ